MQARYTRALRHAAMSLRPPQQSYPALPCPQPRPYESAIPPTPVRSAASWSCTSSTQSLRHAASWTSTCETWPDARCRPGFCGLTVSGGVGFHSPTRRALTGWLVLLVA
jgi:hypothetical protein